MFRIALFLGTNIAILLVLSISMSLFGVNGILDENGIDLDISSLLFISAIIGFAGSLTVAVTRGISRDVRSEWRAKTWVTPTLERYKLPLTRGMSMSVWEIRRGVALLHMPQSFVLVHQNLMRFIKLSIRLWMLLRRRVILMFLSILEMPLQSYLRSLVMARIIDTRIMSLMHSVRARPIFLKRWESRFIMSPLSVVLRLKLEKS